MNPGGQLLQVLLATSRIEPSGHPIHSLPSHIGEAGGQVIHLF
jgi:hypothetical protein